VFDESRALRTFEHDADSLNALMDEVYEFFVETGRLEPDPIVMANIARKKAARLYIGRLSIRHIHLRFWFNIQAFMMYIADHRLGENGTS
jgi:hypothetical protein